MKILLLICVFISFARSELSSSERKCIESRYRNDESLMSRDDVELCGRLIMNLTTEFTKDVMERLRSEDDQTCILKHFGDYKINELYIRGLVQHLYSNKTNLDAYEDDVDESISALLSAVKVLCVSETKYGEDFEQSFKFSKKTDLNSEDLCKRKYFFEKQIINPVEYNVEVPLITASDCANVFKELEESFVMLDDEDKQNTFFGLPAAQAYRCSKSKFADAKILQNIYSLLVIQDFDISPQQTAKLRKRYTNWMTSGVRFLLECIKEI